MKILMVHPHDIFSREEPWTVRIRSLALEFVKKGHQVRLVYFPLNARDASKKINWKGIEVFSLSRKLGVGNFFKNILFLRRLAGWADVVHFQKCFYYAALPALIAGLVRGRHIHYDWDDWEIKIYFYSRGQNYLMGMFLWLLERAMPFLADTVSVSSERLRRECLRYGLPSNRIFEGHVGADLERFNPENKGGYIKQRYGINGPLVIYIGQLHGGQYVELFIDAAEKLSKKIPGVTFMIAGGGYRLEDLKKYSDSLGLNGKLLFTEHIPHDEIPSYIAAADICVACFEKNDITECKSPLKIVEYLASGKPIVASNVGEIQRMVGEAGILTEPGDSASLAEGIERLLKDRVLAQELSKKARLQAERKYNWSNTAENLLDAYRSYAHRGSK
ncbi:MAG: glycosyltransferase family 4 protein [Candidatus Omnitrophica bacterium]|nr:glycosyltransferase family 4 protein [Candidatus Omnitrophota bacterium]